MVGRKRRQTAQSPPAMLFCDVLDVLLLLLLHQSGQGKAGQGTREQVLGYGWHPEADTCDGSHDANTQRSLLACLPPAPWGFASRNALTASPSIAT